MPTERPVSRRQFLLRAGVLGALAAAGQTVVGPLARAGVLAPKPLFDAVRPVLDDLARDTMGGLVAFVAPGPDRWSQVQGRTSEQPGGIDARAHEFMLHSLDGFFPVPDAYVRLLVQAFVTAMEDTGTPIPTPLLDQGVQLSARVDDALSSLLQNDDTVPLSILIASMLNFLATHTDPSSLAGPFADSPFANLTFEQKIESFRFLEEDTSDLVAQIDDGLPEPLAQSLSGLLKFVAGALVEFAAFGSYNEWGVFDPQTRDLRATVSGHAVPVGWTNSQYLAATGYRPVNGWNDDQGYWAGRREATDNA